MFETVRDDAERQRKALILIEAPSSAYCRGTASAGQKLAKEEETFSGGL
jgi:hypothetical protein